MCGISVVSDVSIDIYVKTINVNYVMTVLHNFFQWATIERALKRKLLKFKKKMHILKHWTYCPRNKLMGKFCPSPVKLSICLHSFENHPWFSKGSLMLKVIQIYNSFIKDLLSASSSLLLSWKLFCNLNTKFS